MSCINDLSNAAIDKGTACSVAGDLSLLPILAFDLTSLLKHKIVLQSPQIILALIRINPIFKTSSFFILLPLSDQSQECAIT